MTDLQIKALTDLNNLRTAPPFLDISIAVSLLSELKRNMAKADWFTVGIMANSSDSAISALREMESHFSWPAMKLVDKPTDDGPVFLKANQNTGEVYIRIEFGLGEGILVSCQLDQSEGEACTFGPFPLNFFKVEG